MCVTEFINAGLDESSGGLWIKGLPRYYYYRWHGYKIRYKIYKKKLVSITIIAKNGDIALEEILDEERQAETFPGQTDIKYIMLPNGDRVITYGEFADKICADYDRLINSGMSGSKITAIMQKRFYELLHKSVYFYFGEELSIERQLKLKSEIFLAWSTIAGSSEGEVHRKLFILKERFERYASEVSFTIPKRPRKAPGKLIQEIDAYRENMVKGGMKHGRELDLDKERIYKVKIDPKMLRAIKRAA